MTSYRNLNGCLPVKIFEYYYFKIPIILCPSDNDEMQSFLIETDSGYIANDEKNCEKIILDCFTKKHHMIYDEDIYLKNFKKTSRDYQTSVFADILDNNI